MSQVLASPFPSSACTNGHDLSQCCWRCAGLPLGTEATVMMPDSVDSSFFFFPLLAILMGIMVGECEMSPW